MNLRFQKIVFSVVFLPPSDRSSAFQIFFDVGCVLAIVSLQFVIEFPVSLIDEVNWSIWVEHSTAMVFVTFLHPAKSYEISIPLGMTLTDCAHPQKVDPALYPLDSKNPGPKCWLLDKIALRH
jgi:hypothetical protein